MQIVVTEHLAGIISAAFAGGVETSLVEMCAAAQLDDASQLGAAAEIVKLVDKFNLVFNPEVTTGEFRSLRVLKPANVVSKTDNVEVLMAAGEGSRLEYKSSMFCGMQQLAATGDLVEHPALEGELLKTICAFLNSDGGDLLIGVNDEGKACGGVDLDLKLKKWNLDKWYLHLLSIISGRFLDGAQLLPYISVNFQEANSCLVCQVSVLPRSSRSFVRKQKSQPYEFFVRNGARTESLDLPTFYNHLVAVGGLSS